MQKSALPFLRPTCTCTFICVSVRADLRLIESLRRNRQRDLFAISLFVRRDKKINVAAAAQKCMSTRARVCSVDKLSFMLLNSSS